jgi:biopolymer transport protein ExbD
MINIIANKRKNLISELAPDLTPLIDVIFILVVFLILNFNAPEYFLKVDLPKDEENISQNIVDKKDIKIYIAKNIVGWKVNDLQIDKAANLRNKINILSKNYSDSKILIYVDQDAQISRLITLLTILEKNNFKQTNIAVKRN